MKGKFSLWCQLKVIAVAALLLLVILLLGVVLPNSNDLGSHSQEGGDQLDASLHTLHLYNTSVIIISNFTDPINDERKEYVRSLVRLTWSSTAAAAKSILDRDPSRTNDTFLRDHTLAMSLSTLWILNLKEEFNETWELVQRNYNQESNFWNHSQVHVQMMVTEVVGSMLSCYALTGEKKFLKVAKDVSRRLKPAYNNQTGLSYPFLPSTDDFNDPISTLSQVGGQSLEYLYLSTLLNSTSLLQNRINHTLSNLASTKHSTGFYPDHLFVPTGIWSSSTVTLYSSTKLFYESLIKAYLQSNGTHQEMLEMFSDGVESIESIDGFFGISKTGLKYTRVYDALERRLTNSNCMQSDGCYLGAMLALGSVALPKQEVEEFQKFQKEEEAEFATEATTEAVVTPDVNTRRAQRWMQLAEDITETCYQASIRSQDKLLPESFCFDDLNEATNRVDTATEEEWNRKQMSSNELRPDLAESYFILWRLTGNEKYQTQAWKMVQSIGRYLKANQNTSKRGGPEDVFSNLNADQPESPSQPHLLGATLKYLFLIFSDPETTTTAYPLDKWVFNSAGQPLPIGTDN